MWICAGCHSENRAERNHCWHCGTIKGAGAIRVEELAVTESVELNKDNSRPTVCSKCSSTLDADARFCPSCAAPVLLAAPLNCPQCRKSVVAGSRFCKFCAFDLTQKAAAGPTSKLTGGLDALLADKYHALSDAQLLASLGGDLSTQTEKTLSLALAELKTRTHIDWREFEIANTRVKEAILNVHGPARGPTSTSPYHSFNNLARERADKFIKGGGITAGVSALLFLWGYSYSSNLANSARAGLMGLAGQSDSTYAFAQLCVTFGAIAFIIGVVLLIAGLTQK